MSHLAVGVRVFVSSASDVSEERARVERTLLAIGREVAQENLLVVPFLWESDTHPAVGSPQSHIDSYLRDSELVVAIFGSRLGSGTAAEVALARKLVETGALDNLFFYFRWQGDPEDERSETRGPVRELRTRIEREESALYRTYTDAEDLEVLVARDLRHWLVTWRRVPEICAFALRNSESVQLAPSSLSESRLTRVRVQFDPFGRERECRSLGDLAVRHYQRLGSDACDGPMDQADFGRALKECPGLGEWVGAEEDSTLRQLFPLLALLGHPHLPRYPLRKLPGSQVAFSHEEWYWVFCAVGLLKAIGDDDIGAVRSRPYRNEVHQFISGLFTRLPRDRRETLVRHLMQWLRGDTELTSGEPIARNFAAYVLGMVGAREAEDLLAECGCRDQGEGVRMYCVTSLGKLRSRRYLGMIVHMYESEPDPCMRLTLGQAVCRITGICHFEL